MKILVTSASWKGALTVLESLGKKGHSISLIDSDPYSAGFQSRYCTEGYVSPDENRREEYLKFVYHLVREGQYDILIPISDKSTEYFSECRGLFTPHVRLLLPDESLVELARNKDETYKYAQKQGLAIPETFFPRSLKEVREISESIEFPCMVKEAKGTANSGNTEISNDRELMEFYQGLQGKESWPVIQEYIDGDLYGLTAVCSEGEILDSFMFQVKIEHSAIGTAPYAHSVTNVELLEQGKKLVKALNWTGAIDLDYLKDDEGVYRLLEINPRFSGTLYFAYKCGVDLPYQYFRLAMGQEIIPAKTISYKEGLQFRCILPQEIKLCMRDKKNFITLFKNFLNFRMITDMTFHDPKLLWALMKQSWWYCQDEMKRRPEYERKCEYKSVELSINSNK